MGHHALFGLSLLTIILTNVVSIRVRIPVGIIVEPGKEIQASVLRHGLWLQDQTPDWPRQFVLELKQEIASLDDPIQLHRAVRSLLKEGIHALVSPTTHLAYQILATYADEYGLPFISPLLPEVSRDIESRWSFSIQRNTTWALLDLLRYRSCKDIVYMYDDKHGSERLQKIFSVGYSALNTNLLGVQEIKSAQQANQYLKKLSLATNAGVFYILLDVDVVLATEIISWHLHDARVGKTNYHFFIVEPVPESYWNSKNFSFGVINVTSFLSVRSDTETSFQNLWASLSPDTWKGAGKNNLNIESYFYHEIAVVLGQSMKEYLQKQRYRFSGDDLEEAKKWSRDVLVTPSQKLPAGTVIAGYIKEAIINKGQSGRFQLKGNNKRFLIPIVEINESSFKLVGKWSDEFGLYIPNSDQSKPISLPLKDEKKTYRISSILSPPFFMVRNDTGSIVYSGYCKDLIDLIAKELKFNYTIQMSPDGEYGRYNKMKGQWTGMVGELIRGEADIVVADLHVTADRHKVVDFLDSHMTSSLSLLMKRPKHSSRDSGTFLFDVFSKEVWICLCASAVMAVAVFHALFRFIAEPDNIEAASGIWGKKLTLRTTFWFILGSGLFQATAVYPRCLSSRILGVTWWCFNLASIALYIACATTQLHIIGMPPSTETDVNGALLSSISLESILKESYHNNWPNVLLVKNGKMHHHIKQSSLPFLKEYETYFNEHPENAIRSVSKSVEKIRSSSGGYATFMDSPAADYYSSQMPCETVAVYDVIESFSYGIAVRFGSSFKSQFNEALETLAVGGELSHLREKWFFNRSTCSIETSLENVTLRTQSGLFYVLLVGVGLAALVAVVQHFWRVRRKEKRQQKLSFEEVVMGPQSLPLPPPELLKDSSEEEENGAIDGWANRKLVPTSFSMPHESGSQDELIH